MATHDHRSSRGDDTREKIKLAAQRLFAQRGLEDVTVRDIVDAAGQKNGGSLHYYFGTKETLIKELIADGANVLNAERTRRLDTLEAGGQPIPLREIIRLFADPLGPSHLVTEFDADYVSFLARLTADHHDMLMEALEARRRDSSYRRCLDHLRDLLPHLPRKLLDQRVKLMALYVVAAGSSREGARFGRNDWGLLWDDAAALDNMLDTIEGMLRQPPSPETLRLARARKTGNE